MKKLPVKQHRWFSLAVIIGLLAIGCAHQPAAPLASLENQRGPADIAVLSEQRFADKLILVVKLTPTVIWPAEAVTLDVTTLYEGSEVATESFKPKTADGLLRPGTPVEIPVTVASNEMTDYRLDLRWGTQTASTPEGEAAQVSAEKIETAPVAALKESTNADLTSSIGSVELADTTLVVSDQACAQGTQNCSPSFIFSGTLQNRTGQQVNRVVLEARFAGANGELGEASELEVPDLHMIPGDQRPVRVIFEAPDDPSGATRLVTPQLRVASFQ